MDQMNGDELVTKRRSSSDAVNMYWHKKCSIQLIDRFPNLLEPFETAITDWGYQVSERSIRKYERDLVKGLLAYLGTFQDFTISLHDLDEATLHGFVSWINKQKTAKGEPLAPSSRRGLLLAARRPFEILTTSDRWGDQARRIVADFPQNAWPGSHRKIKPTERLSIAELHQIREASEREILKYKNLLLVECPKLIRSGETYLSQKPLDEEACRRLDVVLVALNEKYPGFIPDCATVYKWNSIFINAFKRHPKEKTETYLYPGPRMLVPFVIIVSIATNFNPETVLGLKLSNIREKRSLGESYIEIIGEKPRASSDQKKLIQGGGDEDTFNLIMMFRILRMWTERLRPFASDRMAERAFLYKKPNRNEVSCFDVAGLNLLTWPKALRLFCQENKLNHFTLKQIRATITDEAYVRTGDIIQAKNAAHHKSARTTWTHYTSDGTRKRQQERLAEVLLLKDRWAKTHGVIDPRILSPSNDKGAATPGFICQDPYDSPQPKQKKGTLCSAYGRCPICPLAVWDVTNISSVANYIALSEAIIRDRHEAPQTWLNLWAPVLQKLERVLSTEVSPEVKDRAGQIRSPLPGVG
jgi:hypothetical protein